MKFAFLALIACGAASAAHAAPGLGEEIYGATVSAGKSEVEARYGRLTGGSADGEDVLAVELSHGFSNRFAGSLLFEFEREPGRHRDLEAVGVEGIVALGHSDALGLDAALYGEYEFVRGAPDAAEAKLLLQHRKGPFDARLNLIFERELERGKPIEFGYAASADWEVVDELRVGLAPFGGLGSTHRFADRDEHYLGPIVKTEIEGLPRGELEIEAGYLVAIGAARDETKGQARLLLEYEFRF
ncbi:MAG: hypothetical protein ACM3YM_00390 [Sphingomonadales bacterium]